ncbi:methylated-DNA--[protein]-cysteine S-methyltransferase [Psychrobacter lutiphocae]|uniref:methylated-DNA--[protein]-cysteine S-methyltransferase n=1 Tax=Psychrobacter lutiphocae TaxID=540500 RepID=UPI00037A5048|nr:methylated-DNA--[protein]-cysteine S-methyltransferase [Psychrobacter lutiphocae]
MLILTSTTFANHSLLLASHSHEPSGKPVLVFINWLNDDHWQRSKSLNKIKIHYQLADSHISFINKNSLSKDNPAQLLLLTAIHQLSQYETGKRCQFDLPLDLSMGTAFQQSVWQALRQIAYGDTISYATLAQHIGKPTAYRAVANANGKNPFSIVIPCHRVIASDGGLGGYTGGLDKKRWLLQLEWQSNQDNSKEGNQRERG